MPEKKKIFIVGSSKFIKHTRKCAAKYATVDEPVLLTGETGVGKNHMAEFIHHRSNRDGKFVTVSVPNIPESLFESEMFGHKKGSFTGASSEQKALVEEAEGGTLFLDEVSETPLSFQSKLLRFIETKTYRSIGDTREKTSNARIIAATNKDLLTAIKDKTFRADLFFRLNILQVEIPPLRQRKEDIKDLVREYSGHLDGKKLHDDFWPVVLNYEWPGNIRELLSILKRAGIDLESPIRGSDIKPYLNRSLYTEEEEDRDDGHKKLDRIWDEVKAGQSFWESAWKKFIDRFLNREEIHFFIREGFTRSHYSLKELAFALNIKENEYKKFVAVLHKYDIHPRSKYPD